MKRIASLAITVAILLLAMPLWADGEEIVIGAVGDIMLAGRWTPLLKSRGYDHPFGGVAATLAGSDINLGNLESPIASSGREYTAKKFRFRAEPGVAAAVRKAGFNLVTLANNHSMDFGAAALTETMANLEAAGIAWIGAGENLAEARRAAIFTVKGKKIAFLGYSLTQPVEFFAARRHPGTAPGYEDIFVPDIAQARKEADYVIVSFHWGREGQGMPIPFQRSTAHKAIDAGADVIIGHHPHVLQGIERYGKGIIFYSLGNFTFASTSTTADRSVIIRLRLDDTRREAEILPLDVLYRRVGFQPRLLSGKPAANVIERLNSLSKTLETEIKSHNNSYFVSF
ncbi:CapA family protein [Geobacter sp. FeAm09]|uniref:CapA family protein n=1 Tax=Geobacter sp. FeAm09 TaxID=2597769 RepID=UPI0011EC9983|nr:CapA family protein [Geobacter sp. FeAm09]QEM69520.1 CapA family protein [Geobacter sp. FeAm09]